MVRYLLDTNIWIALLKENDTKLKKQLGLLAPNEICLCSIIKAELIFGARHSQRIDANLKSLTKIFDNFISYPFDDNAAEHYGVLREYLTCQGKMIGANDLLIASIALAHDLTLITRNRREFAQVPNLRWETW